MLLIFGALILYLVLKNMDKLPKFSENKLPPELIAQQQQDQSQIQSQPLQRNVTPSFAFSAALESTPVANNTEYFGIDHVNLKVNLTIISHAYVIDSLTIKRTHHSIEDTHTFEGSFENGKTFTHTFKQLENEENMIGTHIISGTYKNNLDNISYTIGVSKSVKIDETMISKASLGDVEMTQLEDVKSAQTFDVKTEYKINTITLKNSNGIIYNNDVYLRSVVEGSNDRFYLHKSDTEKLNSSGNFSSSGTSFYIIYVTDGKYILSTTQKTSNASNKIFIFNSSTDIKTEKFSSMSSSEFKNALIFFEFKVKSPPVIGYIYDSNNKSIKVKDEIQKTQKFKFIPTGNGEYWIIHVKLNEMIRLNINSQITTKSFQQDNTWSWKIVHSIADKFYIVSGKNQLMPNKMIKNHNGQPGVITKDFDKDDASFAFFINDGKAAVAAAAAAAAATAATAEMAEMAADASAAAAAGVTAAVAAANKAWRNSWKGS